MRNRTPTLLDRLRTLACLFAALVAVPFLRAEKLPLKVYTVADGLGMDQINVIRQDSRNLLWFGTGDGVSWFDGYQFVRYTTDDGLPGKVVSDVLETRSREIWLGTGAGACLFRWEAERGDESGGSRFVTAVPQKPLPDRVDAGRLVEGPDGSIWCASSYGLCRITRAAGSLNMQLVDIGMRNTQWGDTIVRDLTFDKFGTLGSPRTQACTVAVPMGGSFDLPARPQTRFTLLNRVRTGRSGRGPRRVFSGSRSVITARPPR